MREQISNLYNSNMQWNDSTMHTQFEKIFNASVILERLKEVAYQSRDKLTMNMSHLRNYNTVKSILENTVSTSEEPHAEWLLTEFQLIKAIVLVIVLSLVLLSTCKLVVKSVARNSEGKEK